MHNLYKFHYSPWNRLKVEQLNLTFNLLLRRSAIMEWVWNRLNTSPGSKAPDGTEDRQRLSGNQAFKNFCLGENKTIKAYVFMRLRNQ